MPGQYLPPWLIQLVGIAIVVGAVIYWMVTSRESVTIIGVGVSLIGIGAYSGAQKILKNGRDEP